MKSYEIKAGWDENERSREGANGRIYTSTAPRKVYSCTLVEGDKVIDGEQFSTKREAVRFGENWIAKASK